MSQESLHVAVVDIGKVENIGWAIEGPSINQTGSGLDDLVTFLADAGGRGPLALGFEAPMFVPYGRHIHDLDKCRQGEADRAFSVSAGASVLAKSLVIVPHILSRLRDRAPATKPTFRWHPPPVRGELLLFEAFVSHQKRASHIECAQRAVREFKRRMQGTGPCQSDICEPQSLNLLGAMLLRVGWLEHVSALSEPCLVVRPRGR